MVFCEVCKINTANMKSHCKSKKHTNGGKRDAMTEEQLKEYHKKYYIEKNLKDKYKEKKKCECCDKMVAKYNWSKHTQTEKHFKKYHKQKANDKTCDNFYSWLIENTDYIKEYDLLMKIYDMFDLNKNHYNIKLFENIKIVNGPIQKKEIYDILKIDGFIFPSR